MLTTTPNYQILWEKLPDDYILPNDPVDDINHPSLAAALTEILQLAGGGLLAATTLNSSVALLLSKPDCHCYLKRTNLENK